jgi:CheY-like chemotaxis protein
VGSGKLESAVLWWFPDHARTIRPPLPPPRLVRHMVQDATSRQIHILMVEDDAAIAEMYRVQFEHDGYRVTVATTGEVAVSSFAGAQPDIVLLDLLLPDRSGFEVLSALNERFPNHPPVVILSNYGEPSMMDRGRSLGAVEYLVKSRVTPSDISEQIPVWVEQGRRGGRRES